MSPLEIVRILNFVVAIAQRAGINIAKYNAMRELTEDGELSDEQLQMLAEDARVAVDRL